MNHEQIDSMRQFLKVAAEARDSIGQELAKLATWHTIPGLNSWHYTVGKHLYAVIHTKCTPVDATFLGYYRSRHDTLEQAKAWCENLLKNGPPTSDSHKHKPPSHPATP
jgi:hypothetical protein